MVRMIFLSPDDKLPTDLKPEDLAVALQNLRGRLWVDIFDETPEMCEPIMLDVFGFHPLAVDDALQETHVPKVDDWGSYLYVTMHAVAYNGKTSAGTLDTYELDMFLGPNFLLTYHNKPIEPVDRVWMVAQRDKRVMERGVDYLMYRLVDELATCAMTVVEAIDGVIEEVEDQVFAGPAPETLEAIFTLKRVLLSLRRTITPQREVLNKLGRDEFAVVARDHRVFFRDVYDHHVRLHDLIESLRDLVSGALDIYLSVVNNRMNEVMKTLTIITTLFMPISFLTGFFGMNFFQPVTPLPGWTGRVAFAFMIMVLAFLPMGMFLWVRRRRWL